MKKVTPTRLERERFDSDSELYRLAWKCPDCVHFAAVRRNCSLEYPTGDLMEAASFDTPEGTYVFCKHFELI